MAKTTVQKGYFGLVVSTRSARWSILGIVDRGRSVQILKQNGEPLTDIVGSDGNRA
jgi:hypothetical protein